ncbi:MAG: rhomboid family intramembrane serine protease [Nanobdellota archaeon]
MIKKVTEKNYLKNIAIKLIGINVLIFFLQIFIDGLTENFLLVSQDVFTRPWILITSMFLHADPAHLLFNMYALLLFGPLIEQKVGSKRFLTVFLISGIMAALISLPFYDRALGASGAIMGIIGLTIMLMPDLQVLLFFAIPMSLRTAGIIFAFIDIFGIFVPSGVANIAHLAGLGTGLLAGWYFKKKRKNFYNRFSTNKKKNKKSNPSDVVIELSDDDVNDYLKNGRF